MLVGTTRLQAWCDRQAYARRMQRDHGLICNELNWCTARDVERIEKDLDKVKL